MAEGVLVGEQEAPAGHRGAPEGEHRPGGQRGAEADPQEYQSIQGSGIRVYYEVLPGVFVPVPANMANLAPGTPLYMQVPAGTPAGNTGATAVPLTAAPAGSTPQGA